MSFKWRDFTPLMFPNDFGTAFFRLPKYVVSFNHSQSPHLVNYGDGNEEDTFIGPHVVIRLTIFPFHCSTPLSGSLFSAAGDNVVAGGQELFAGELPTLDAVRVHQLGQFRCRAGHCARKDGVARYDPVITGHDVRHGQQ